MTITIIAVFLAVFLFIIALYYLFSKDTVSTRMKHYASTGNIQDNFRTAAHSNNELGSIGYVVPMFRFSKYFARLPQATFFDRQMLLSGLSLHGSEFVYLTGLSTLFIFCITYILILNALQALIISIVWLLSIYVYIRNKISRRAALFNTQLGEAIGMMSNAMKSGFSFLQTLDLISKEMKPPIASEFAQTLREMQLGVSMDEALRNLYKRIPSDDLDLVITAVLIQRQVGGNMSKMLDNIGHTIISRVKIQGEVRVLTAEGRLSGYLIAASPFIMAGIFLLIDPNYFDEFLKHPLAIMSIIIGLAMQIIGMLIIHRMIDIKF